MSLCAAKSDERLERGLLAIRFAGSVELAQERCNAFLDEHTNSPAATGRAYLALALHRGFRWDAPDGIVRNAEEALRHPLATDDACRAYAALGEALQVEISRGLSLREEAVLRKRALIANLKGLSLVMSQMKVFQKQEVPQVGGFTLLVVSTNDPAYRAMVARHEEQMIAHDKAIAANALIDWRGRFEEAVVGLYRATPFSEEISAEGRTLKLDPAVLKGLIDKVNASSKPSKSSEASPRGGSPLGLSITGLPAAEARRESGADGHTFGLLSPVALFVSRITQRAAG